MKRALSEKRKRSKSDYIRIIVCLFIVGGFLYTIISQQINLVEIRREEAECQMQIEEQQKKYSQLQEKVKRNSGDDYYEEKARDEGYVGSDETVFIVGN